MAYITGGHPELVITEQPKQRGMRFRYECEGRSAGSIPGENSTADKKTWPTCMIANYNGKALVRVSLVSKDERPRPHPHSLVGKDCEKGICTVNIGPDTHMQAMFSNLGIQCVKRKDVKSSVQDRLNLKIDPFNTATDGQDRNVGDIDLNIVRLCFEAFLVDEYGRMIKAVKPVVSNPIYDKKATCSALLRICRYDRSRGSCRGGDEIFLLCDKVQKEDISIVFYEQGTNWEALGEFSATDVHRQVAIVFRTPPYRTQDLDRDSVDVKFRLVRPSDQEASDSKTYTYLAEQHGVRKRYTPHWDDQKGVKKQIRTNILGKNMPSPRPQIKPESNYPPTWTTTPQRAMPTMPAFNPYVPQAQAPVPVNNAFSSQDMGFQYRDVKTFSELLNMNNDDHNVLENLTVTPPVTLPVDFEAYKENMSITNTSIGYLAATADVTDLTSSLQNISIEPLDPPVEPKAEPASGNSRTPFPQQVHQYTQPQYMTSSTYMPQQSPAPNPFAVNTTPATNIPQGYMPTTTYQNQMPQTTASPAFTNFPAMQTLQENEQDTQLQIPSDLLAGAVSIDMDNSSLVNQLVENTT